MGRKNSKKQQPRRKQETVKSVKGTLDITRSGMGFVVAEGLEADVLVRPSDLNTAMHGDTVRVRIRDDRPGRRLQGVVEEVIRRKRNEFVGRVEMNNGFGFFIPEADRPMPDVFVPGNNLNGAQDNDRVVVRILEWERGKRPMGEVVNVLSTGDDHDVAMKELLLENSFPLSFSDEALEIAARIPDRISQKEIDRRRDVRRILTFTIDPIDAKDYDDALSFRKLKNGHYEIGVHIADVSHYLDPGTVLDREAYERATSVYLPDRVNPMLPEEISNVICSLLPREDKLTFSVIFEITPKAEVKKYWIGKTVIHSKHRFTYEEVQAIIEAEDGLYAEQILTLNNLAQRFRKKRFANGAINFSSQEVRFKLDDKGEPIGIIVKESLQAHQLIEEFMLLANRTMASEIARIKVKGKPLPFPYRVHDDPDEEKLIPFVAFAKKFGHKFDMSSPDAIAASFNQLLDDVHGKPEQHVLEQLGIRTMAKAKYTTENIGHYGLGFTNYCHFTSPIRRYPDILVHRIMEGVLGGQMPVDKKLEEKCKHCSERERAAMEVERAANKYKQVQYMKKFLGEEFEGVISGVAAFGFWVETIEHKCEGLVSVNSLLEYDEFRLVEADYSLQGRRTGRKFRMGDKVWIKVVGANLTKRQLDYDWVIAGEVGKEKRAQREKKSGAGNRR
ncbi:MAG TPA: ribonuclease R [Chitinophagaceae bacterium]|nr:ribonuclease R [Chitinophagaceae bacterium]